MVESVKNGNWADFLSTAASPNIMKGEENAPWAFSIINFNVVSVPYPTGYKVWSI